MAEKRKTAVNKYLWDKKRKFYFDYHIKLEKPMDIYSLAGVVPLFVQMADPSQADAAEKLLKDKFLQVGVVTSLTESGEQWDYPNGWAPLQWFAIKGLLNYDKKPLALEIIKRWLHTLRSDFQSSRMLMEKYNVCSSDREAKYGEYRVQGGFGWTNGTALKFMALQEELSR